MFLKFLNPYDRCTSKLILLLFASTRALLIPVSMKFSMYSSCRLIFLLSSTNESIFDLLAHDIQFFNSEAASSRFCSFKMFLNDSFNSYPRYNLGSLALICASFTSWFSVRFLGLFLTNICCSLSLLLLIVLQLISVILHHLWMVFHALV